MELKPGYKQTEVGVIPEDWDAVPLGKLYKFSNGVNADKAAYGKGLRFINVLEPITYSHIRGPEITGLVELTSQVASAYTVNHGDIVFNRTSETDTELGMAAAYLGHEKVVFGGFVIRGQAISDDLDPTYAGYALRGEMVRDQIIPLGQGAVRANIGQESLRKVRVLVPPEHEQKLIAEALQDIDSLLTNIQESLYKKRQIKQAAMQELLTGKWRLSGFEGEWEVKRLGDVGEIKSGGTPSTSQRAFWDGGVPWCTPTDITALDGRKYLTTTARTISPSGLQASSAEIIPPQSLIMTTRATIGECAINTLPMTTNQGFKNIVPSPVVGIEFLYYLMSTQKQRLISLCGGSTFLEIGKKELSAYEIRLPLDRGEQDAISSTLSAMDEELQALEARLGKAENLKQGMMQHLLTGKIRLT